MNYELKNSASLKGDGCSDFKSLVIKRGYKPRHPMKSQTMPMWLIKKQQNGKQTKQPERIA